jgi:hypothetical protein
MIGKAEIRAMLGGLALAGALAMTSGAHAKDPELLTFGAGGFDVNGDETTGAISLEFMDDRRWVWVFQPMVGAMITLDAAVYGYAGLGVDLFFGRRVVLTPSFAVGVYLENGGKDLGHPIEFRTGIKLGYRFDDRSRVGIDFHHLSNAGLDDRNPGANQLLVTYSIPFTRD